jgi:hypothetical protein
MAMRGINRCLLLALLWAVLLPFSCRKPDPTSILAEYLKEEKRLRNKIEDKTVFGDSLKAAQKKYSIDMEQELSRLRKHPEQWPVLLRKLKRE